MMEIASRAVALHFSTEFLDRGRSSKGSSAARLTFLRGIRSQARDKVGRLTIAP
jgi:hypothetical protein